MRIRHNILASIYQKRHAFLKAVILKIGIPKSFFYPWSQY